MYNIFNFVLFLLATLLTSTAAAPFPAYEAPPTGGSVAWPGWDGIDKLFVFGASYTSTGFNWLKSPAPSASLPLGNSLRGTTSSNGPCFVTYLTTTFNASKVLTYNFAFPGAQVDHAATRAKPLAPGVTDKPGNDMTQQVFHGFLPSYTDKVHAPYAEWKSSSSLFVSFFGINDAIAYYKRQSSVRPAVTDKIMAAYTANLDALYKAGARHFLLLNTPPMESSPYFAYTKTTSGTGDDHMSASELATDAANMAKTVEDYNSRFPALVSGFKASHPEATLFWFDTHQMYSSMHSSSPFGTLPDTSAYGLQPFKNLTRSCQFYAKAAMGEYLGADDFDDPRCGGSVGEYFWLNGLHVTWSVHKIMAGRIAEGLRKGVAGRLV
ncbi:MAG: hypothetical protein Q9219_001564 [cf. Caloplaca sp. 3 TL-2023]